MTAEDMWSPILFCFGTTWSSDASSGSRYFVRTGGEESGVEFLFLLQQIQCFVRFLYVSFSKKRLISRVGVDFFFGLHEGVTEQ